MLEKSMNQEPFLVNNGFLIKKESPMIYLGEDVKEYDDGSIELKYFNDH